MRVLRPHFVGILVLLTVLTSIVLGQEATPVATPEPVQQVLTIWWPDLLAAPENTAVQDLISTQTADFTRDQVNVLVESRLKRVGTVGGIMSTLRTGSLVAEGAMPALTLIRRQDLVTAERSGLLQSMEGMIPSSIQGDLDTALQLGQIDGELYGLPYLLDLELLVYHAGGNHDYTTSTFENFLEHPAPVAFPVGNDSGLSDTLLLQYLVGGGSVSADTGLNLDETALRTLIEFYAQAKDRGVIGDELLNYTTANDYRTAFLDGDYVAGTFTSTQYLEMVENDSQLGVSTIPTLTGQSTGILNGWMWVLIASESDQQALALEYIRWMMNSTRQTEIAKAIHMLPSQQSALEMDLADDVNSESIMALLDDPILPITESTSSNLARSLHTAVASILRGERNAEEAIQYVLSQQSN